MKKMVKKGRKLKVTRKSTNQMRKSTPSMTAVMTHDRQTVTTHDRQTVTPCDARHGVELKKSPHVQ